MLQILFAIKKKIIAILSMSDVLNSNYFIPSFLEAYVL